MVKLFRKRHKSEDGEEEEELVLDTDSEEQEPAQEAAEAEPAPAAAVPPSDPLAQIRADADNETAAGKTPSEGDAAPSQPDDSLDASLLELFREAKNEVEESTLASELADIPIQDLLSDLVSVSQELGATPRAHPAASQRKTSNVDPKHGQGGK